MGNQIHFVFLMVRNYLEAMNVDFKWDFKIDGVQMSSYLPTPKAIFEMVSPWHTNSDRKTYKGVVHLEHRFLELLAKKKNTQVIQINMAESMDIREHEK